MKLHHIAIATKNLINMKEFYSKLPYSKIIQENFYENGTLRSVWFELAHNVLLMLEDKPYNKAPEALVFDFPNSYSLKNLEKIFSFVERTNYTIYFLDPDNNKLGFSSYPKKILQV